MADETYEQNLVRAAVAYLQFQCQMTAAQQMFGKGYFALGVPEKIAVDQAVTGLASSNYQVLTRELLNPDKPGVGFLANRDNAIPPPPQTTRNKDC